MNASSGTSLEADAGEEIKILGNGLPARADVCLGSSGAQVELGGQNYAIPGGDGASPAQFLTFLGSGSGSSSERFSEASTATSRLQLELLGPRSVSLAAGLISGATMQISGNQAKVTYDSVPVVGAAVTTFRSADADEGAAVYAVDSSRLLSEDVTSTECGLARVGRRVSAETVSDVGSGRKTVIFSLEGLG